MPTIIKFGEDDKCQALGRNGVMAMTGIAIDSLMSSILLQPITSKNQIGRAFLEIPKLSLHELIGKLQEIESGISEVRGHGEG